MPVSELLAAFMVGLLGSVHCIGMCGGIVSALTFSLPERKRQTTLGLLPYLLLYNLGRLSSYAVIGGLFGWLGQAASDSFTASVAGWGGIIAGVFLVLLGLYVAGWLQALVVLERLGGFAWRAIEPLGRRMMPVRSPLQALGLGLIWGWLPCGMVYAMLPLAITAGTLPGGASVLLAFGLGTLPMLMLMGSTAEKLRQFTRRAVIRQVMGVVILLLGVYTLFAPGAHDQHAHHATGQAEVHHHH